jgi:hypothetical protein
MSHFNIGQRSTHPFSSQYHDRKTLLSKQRLLTASSFRSRDEAVLLDFPPEVAALEGQEQCDDVRRCLNLMLAVVMKKVPLVTIHHNL